MRDFQDSQLGYMTWETYTEIFRDFIPTAIKLNWRGEPLLHPNIVDMVKFAKNMGVIDVRLNTNGQLLTIELAEKLMDAGLDELAISCDGASKHTYELIRGNGNYENLFKNIVDNYTLCLYRRRNGLHTPKVTIQICEQPDNEHEINDWYKIFYWYADKLRIGKLFDPQGKRGYNIKQPHNCSSLWQRIVVSWNGDIYPCTAAYLEKFKLGNIREKKLYDIWHSEEMNYYRYILSKFGRQSLLCATCTSYC